jgi:uncharacterized protein (DUF697 family)
MKVYEQEVFEELKTWKKSMVQDSSLLGSMAKSVQSSINNAIPERIHKIMTDAIRQMTKSVIFGAYLTTLKNKKKRTLPIIEELVKEKIDIYSKTAAAEGAVTGYGGILMGFADLPLWLSIKIKMLFDIGNLYGYDLSNYKERIFLLHIFQLTFSRQKERKKIFNIVKNWDKEKDKLPPDINEFDWRTFQIEYRDYLDLAKLLQLIPGFGAIVGIYINHKLTRRLGKYAMNAYRMRHFETSKK